MATKDKKAGRPAAKTSAPVRKTDAALDPGRYASRALTVKQGTVSIALPAGLTLPPNAGKLTAAQVKKLRKARTDVGRACHDAADALEKAGDEFAAPKGLTAALLRERGDRADGMDRLVADGMALLRRLVQANLIVDGEADDLLGQLNDQVKAQGKRDPALLATFAAVTKYFKKAPKKAPAAPPIAS